MDPLPAYTQINAISPLGSTPRQIRLWVRMRANHSGVASLEDKNWTKTRQNLDTGQKQGKNRDKTGQKLDTGQNWTKTGIPTYTRTGHPAGSKSQK